MFVLRYFKTTRNYLKVAESLTLRTEQQQDIDDEQEEAIRNFEWTVPGFIFFTGSLDMASYLLKN